MIYYDEEVNRNQFSWFGGKNQVQINYLIFSRKCVNTAITSYVTSYYTVKVLLPDVPNLP